MEEPRGVEDEREVGMESVVVGEKMVESALENIR